METELLLAFFSEGQRRVRAGESPEEVTEWVQRTVRSVGTPPPDETLDIKESIEFYDGVLADRQRILLLPPDERPDLSFPWPSWNKVIDPLPGGMLMTVAGADGAGKTTYGENLCEWYARNRNRVVYFHFELSHAVMMDRRTARWSGMTVRQLKGLLGRDEMDKLERVRQALLKWQGNITYVHCPGWSMERVAQAMDAMRQQGKCDVAIVDYLEKAQPSQRQLRAYGTNSFQREADSVEILKNAAERNEIPVVMLTQMNKAGKSKSFDDLERTDIRGAGEKTEKANVVVLLSRERVGADGYSPFVDVRIAKNTLGPTGDVRQYMEAQYFRVLDTERVELGQLL